MTDLVKTAIVKQEIKIAVTILTVYLLIRNDEIDQVQEDVPQDNPTSIIQEWTDIDNLSKTSSLEVYLD